MNSWGVRAIVALLAMVCVGGGIVLGGYVAVDLYSAQHTGLGETCNSLQEPPPGSVAWAGEGVDGRIGYVPLGVWCTYPAEEEGESIVVAPSWRLSGFAFASVALIVAGGFALWVLSRLRAAGSARVA